MPRYTRDDFEQAVRETLTANGGEMEFGDLQAALSQYAAFFRLWDFMRKNGTLNFRLVANVEGGHQHLVSLGS